MGIPDQTAAQKQIFLFPKTRHTDAHFSMMLFSGFDFSPFDIVKMNILSVKKEISCKFPFYFAFA